MSTSSLQDIIGIERRSLIPRRSVIGEKSACYPLLTNVREVSLHSSYNSSRYGQIFSKVYNSNIMRGHSSKSVDGNAPLLLFRSGRKARCKQPQLPSAWENEKGQGHLPKWIDQLVPTEDSASEGDIADQEQENPEPDTEDEPPTSAAYK